MWLFKNARLILILVIITTPVSSEEMIVRISAHPEFAPVAYQVNSEIYGVGPELAARLFSDLGIQSRFVLSGPWARVVWNAENGKIDLIAGIYQSKERETSLVYVTNPFMEIPFVIFTNKEALFTFTNWYDLVGFIGGGIRGEKFDAEFETFIKENSSVIKIDRVSTIEQNFGKLLLGRIDYIPCSKYVGMYKIEEMGISDKIEISTIPLIVRKIYFAFSGKSPVRRHIDEINIKIEEYKRAGIINELIEKHSRIYMEMIRLKNKK